MYSNNNRQLLNIINLCKERDELVSAFSISRRKTSSDRVNLSHSVLTVLRFSSENKQVCVTEETLNKQKWTLVSRKNFIKRHKLKVPLSTFLIFFFSVLKSSLTKVTITNK